MKTSMQMQLLLLAALHSSFASKSLPVDLAAVEQSVLKLARSGKTGRNVSQASAAMRSLVNNFLTPHLAKTHNDDQDLMNTAESAFTRCSADHGMYNGSIANLSSTHQSCRDEESRLKGVWDQACGTDRDTQAQAFIASCDVFALRDTLPNTLPEGCKKTTGTANEDEALRLRDYFNNLKADWVQWNSSCATARNISQVANDTCDSAGVTYNAAQAQCDAAQNALDYAACWQHRLGDCAGFARCWAEANSSYTALNSTVVSAMAARKTEFAGLQRILCYLDTLDASVSSGADVNAGIQVCDSTVVDTSAYDITLAYYAEIAPLLPVQPSCNGAEVWPRPGTDEYISQEYAPLPDDAPAKECTSVCCQYCNYFPCTDDLFRCSDTRSAECCADEGPDPWNIRAYTVQGCCTSGVSWVASSWANVSCDTSCGQSATNTTRSVQCADANGTVFPDSTCANYTKPATTQTGCVATADCVTCVSSACNVTGTYLNNCGGFDPGSCATCTVPNSSYATGIGDTVNQNSCPTANCSTRAVCPAGQYLDGCGGTSPGSCANCTGTCLIGYYSDGCTGISAGSCLPCVVASANLATSVGSDSGSCSMIQETQATASTGNYSSIPLASFTLDKDAASHTEVVSGSQLTWVRLTEFCETSYTPGSISYTLATRTDRTYKVAVQAAWRPVSAHGAKSNSYCNTGAGSVLQLHLVGSGSDSTPTGANVTACFDYVTYTGWSTVWFEFAPSATQVQMTFHESMSSCLSVKSVSVYEE